MKRIVVFVALSCVAASSWADECKHTARRQANESVAGIEQVKIIARRGTLAVDGTQGARSVTVDGNACANKKETLDEVRLQTRRTGNTLIIETVMPDMSGSFLGMTNESWMDVRVEVPSNLRLDIEDSSGEMVVRNVSTTTIRDGSGELRVEGVTGDLNIDDASGAIHVSRVSGGVTVRDDSGELHIVDVAGNVSIPNDGSGELRIDKVQGSVHIGSDGSGAISVANVRDNVRIDDDGSGAIYVREVGGDVTVGSDGSGDIRVEDVRGSLLVESDGSGGVTHRGIEGKVSVPD